MTVTSPIEAETHTELNDTPWLLSACSSWLAGQTFPIRAKHGGNLVKIGRGNHCDIIFPGTHLSREHVELRIEQHHIYVKDKGSVNGTYINEVRVTEGVLRPGDKLRLDVYSFEVEGPQLPESERAHELEDDDNATRFRQAITPLAEPTPPEQAEAPPKQWVTKPTSPGNRVEPSPTKEPAPVALYVLAGALVVAVALLGAYLFLG